MANVLIFDPNSTPVPNRAVRYIRSADTNNFIGRADVIINPTMPAGAALDSLVVDNGTVRGMNEPELAAIAQAQQQAMVDEIARIKDFGKALSDADDTPTGRVLRALIELIVEEINILRTRAGLAARTREQVVSAIKAKIDAQ